MLPSGGDDGREMLVEATDTLSEMCSLEGVPGGNIEAMLGALDGLLVAATGKFTTGGVSGFGVDSTRSTCARFLVGTSAAEPGVPGRDTGGVPEGVCDLLGRSMPRLFGRTEPGGAISIFPGC